MRYLVTGGLGFIGSNFLHRLVPSRPGDSFVNVDCCSYAANPKSVESLEGCAEVVTPYFVASGTGQVNVVLPVS